MTSTPIKIAVAGAGRMGQTLAAAIERQSNFQLVGIWQRGQAIEPLVEAADVVIDFSLPEGTDMVLAAAISQKKPLVCGVSGLSEAQTERLAAAGAHIPLLFDRNMSLGIAVLERSIREAAASLGPGFDIAISEVHHEHKKDAPSGTALKLGEAIAASRGESGTGAVTFQVERRGEVPGDHEVTMRSGTETLTFAHSVTTREVFADGAIRAAQWLVDQEPGQYSMQDVLFAGLG
jgi:4-hydroxy-tetrahydrodipicolinate reductase